MANALVAPGRLVRHIEPVMSRQPVEGELEHDLARALRPAVTLLRVFEPFQLAANIDEHPGKLRTHGVDRVHNALFGGDDLIA
jgi:hypothetical protein